MCIFSCDCMSLEFDSCFCCWHPRRTVHNVSLCDGQISRSIFDVKVCVFVWVFPWNQGGHSTESNLASPTHQLLFYASPLNVESLIVRGNHWPILFLFYWSGVFEIWKLLCSFVPCNNLIFIVTLSSHLEKMNEINFQLYKWYWTLICFQYWWLKWISNKDARKKWFGKGHSSKKMWHHLKSTLHLLLLIKLWVPSQD